MYIVHSDRYRLHATTADVPGCPFHFRELPERAERIADALRDARIGTFLSPQDWGRGALARVHPVDYLDYLENAYALRQAFLGDGLPVVADAFPVRNARRKPTTYPGIAGWYAYDGTVPILAGTWEAAYGSAQCALTAADLVRSGESVAYALCRPPGHHAAADLAGGYSYLNNAALAVRHLQEEGAGRVAVIDIDYHHGNGTQEIFYTDPTTLYISLHADTALEYPFFWGGADERGEGPGLGCTLNLPLPDDTDNDAYLAALEQGLSAIRAYAPNYLIVSAGFDLMAGDPEVLNLGFRITIEGLQAIARRLASLRLPTVLIQEGGYSLDRIGEYAVAFLSAFAPGC